MGYGDDSTPDPPASTLSRVRQAHPRQPMRRARLRPSYLGGGRARPPVPPPSRRDRRRMVRRLRPSRPRRQPRRPARRPRSPPRQVRTRRPAPGLVLDVQPAERLTMTCVCTHVHAAAGGDRTKAGHRGRGWCRELQRRAIQERPESPPPAHVLQRLQLGGRLKVSAGFPHRVIAATTATGMMAGSRRGLPRMAGSSACSLQSLLCNDTDRKLALHRG